MGTNREEIGRIVKRFRRECDSEKARDAGVLLVDRGSMLALLDALDAPGEGALEGPDAERILADLAKGCSAEEAERRIARAKEELRKLRMPPGPRAEVIPHPNAGRRRASSLAPPRTSQGPASGSGDFGASATWLRENRTRHAGKWVALKGGELVAADVSRRAVQSRIADRSDLRDLLVVRIDGQRR